MRALRHDLPVEDLLHWLHQHFPELSDATVLRLYHALIERKEWVVTPADMAGAQRLNTVRVLHYLKSNEGATINYGKRYRAGKPISSAMAESAVNQVLNARMCKNQQMRWSPRGAHLLAQVRSAVINGDLKARLKKYTAESVDEISEEVRLFLEQLQRAVA